MPEDKARFIKENGIYVSSPHGNSMWPFIRGGTDSVVLLPPGGKYRKYDVILYIKEDGTHVLHRVLVPKDGYCVVRGDNCYEKEYVRNEQIIGVLFEVLRKGKKPVKNKGAMRFLAAIWQVLCPFRAIISRIRRAAAGKRARRKNKK